MTMARGTRGGRMKRKHKRMMFVGGAMGALGIAAALIFLAFDDNLVFFFTPSDLSERSFAPEQRLRVGGLVAEGSWTKSGDGLTHEFVVTDGGATLQATYTGIVPDLFKEGQGVVAEGHLRGGVFYADEVLAKHDENYMPREVAEALRESGQWQGAETAGAE